MKPNVAYLFASMLLAAGGARAAAVSNLDCEVLGSEVSSEADTLPDKDALSDFSLAVVTVPKVNFVSDHSDRAACPSPSRSCMRKGYLLQNNVVLLQGGGKEPRGFTCVSFIDKRGSETDGWLPSSSLKSYPAQLDWIGHWRAGTYAEIDIKRKSPAKATASGSATAGPSDAPHEGDFEEDIDTRKTIQAFSQNERDDSFAKATTADCVIVMRQLGPYLLATDDVHCGGADVTFAGIYVKR